jgi:hypothetical protein
VRRHADSNNLILLAVLLECKRVVALMAVDNEEPMSTYNSPLCMLIKVLQLLQPKLVCSLAVLRDCDNLVLGQILLLILGREVIAAFEDNEGWNSLPCRVDALDDCCLLSIALLYCLWLSLSL